MKIRIQQNKVRYRLSKSDVAQLAAEGYLEEKTTFPQGQLTYALQSLPDTDSLSASFENQQITIYIPESFAKTWPDNNVVGTDFHMPLNAGDSLYILVEKDFKCLDNDAEDQSDNYENPNQTC
ncbi:DUF7009 family protein [Dyadobacter sp. Leaf189]|uniref:DUF7009 family protein n=1 Tax=Dyadobacter sp. Leaf189 TaxID=1736295 RepID=UPI0006FBA5D5|nr:hypothetical protein [Dyadobacter sp. Leaf189]KQS31217.1 hypothetical protein ASG33_12860 [Dyadobacter sp. Leaf189]